MRLRLKLCDKSAVVTSTTVRIQDDCTLEQLRWQIIQEMLKEDEREDFKLSLNKKDELSGSPEATLKSLGLRSGDLLWVMAENSKPGASPLQSCLPEEACSDAPVEDIKTATAEEQVPSITFNTSSPVEALCQLVHAALLDSGLELLQEGSDEGPILLSAGSLLQYVICTLHAHDPPAKRAACSVKYVTFGNSLVVWGSTAGGRTCHTSIAAADHIRVQPGIGDHSAAEEAREPRLGAKDVSGLIMRLKDGFIHPLLIALCAEEGREPPPSFQLLPTELKLLCLCHLQARDLAKAASVSRDLRHVASTDVLWEPLFVAEFGAPSPSDGLLRITGGFKPAFGFRWAERERRRHQLRLMARDPRMFRPGTGPSLVVPHPYFPAGAVGGDFDRLPHPFLGFSGNRSSGVGAFFGSSRFGTSVSRRPRWALS